MKLYEITNQYETILQDVFNPETGEVNETELAKLDQITTDIKEKGINVASYIKNIEAEVTAIKDAVAHMEARKLQLTNRIESMKNYLQFNMEKCQISEISSPYFVVRLKKCPYSVEITDDSSIPSEYKKIKEVVNVDKIKIKENILAGFMVPGAAIKQNTRLEIK